ncbi:hypothetical protein OJF2_63480 [Aquisphaera giovannonii]|uniref:Uncharacterized protein n=1 Tax=Aquisphaera giovannonii TaxID=406548 RepID=A0A5B9WB86_9BACT|nr:hypothetical protein [Aquisphaera giovannonii]QEH37757.1 hypothetical protein OJF2_63480 [Aquisphaera giovannonii]
MTATALELIVMPVFWCFLYSLAVGFVLSKLIAGVTFAATRLHATTRGRTAGGPDWSIGDAGLGGYDRRSSLAASTTRPGAGRSRRSDSTACAGL